MFGLDPDIGGSALRLWVAAGSAALLVFVCALAIDWTRTPTIARVIAVVIGAVLGGTLAWAFLNAAGARDRNAERRGLETRAAELNVQVLAPGSPLSCLDAISGDSVEAACEKALFATPANVAMATSYVAARLALLADMNAYTQRGGGNIDGALLPLRRGLEADRFGFVAHMLAVRDGCSVDRCQALSLLHDPSKVLANLSGQTLDHYLDRYVVAWAQLPGVPVADGGAPPPAPVAAQTGEPAAPPKKSVLNIDFPSADSIPAVSIMTPEPKGPLTPAAAAAAVAAGQQSSAKVAGPQQMPPMPGTPAGTASRETKETKGKRKQAANPPPAQTAAQAPPQSGPPVDPVWSPGATLASPQPAASAAPPIASAPAASAPAANFVTTGVPLAGMPIQLSPFTSAPQGASR
jgi:hypothetical protein